MESPARTLSSNLAENVEAVCKHYLSNGRRCGNYWIVGDVNNNAGRSLYVRLKGPLSGAGARGRWTDYVAPRVMLRICKLAPSLGRLTGFTQHNFSALREVA